MRVKLPDRVVRYSLRPRMAVLSELADRPSQQELDNGRYLNLEAPLSNLVLGVAPSFFALFAIQLGASNTMVGWLTSGAALVNLFWLIPCGRLIQRARTYRSTLAVAVVFHRLAIMLMAAVPLLPLRWQAWGVVGLATLSALPGTMWGLSFHSSSGELFSRRHLSRLVGQRWAIASVTSFISLPLLGELIDIVPQPTNYQVLFLGTGLLSLGSLWMISRLKFPERAALPCDETLPGPGLLTPGALVAQHRPFVLLEVGLFLVNLALYSAVPLFRIYWVRDLGATGGWVGLLTAVYALGATAGSILWGRWSHPRRDPIYLLVTSAICAGGYPLLTAASASLMPLLGVGLLGGFFGAGSDLLIFNRIVQVTPRLQRPTFIAMHSMMINVVAFVGPLVSTVLIDLWGARAVLVTVGGLGIMGAAALYNLGWRRFSYSDS